MDNVGMEVLKSTYSNKDRSTHMHVCFKTGHDGIE